MTETKLKLIFGSISFLGGTGLVIQGTQWLNEAVPNVANKTMVKLIKMFVK